MPTIGAGDVGPRDGSREVDADEMVDTQGERYLCEVQRDAHETHANTYALGGTSSLVVLVGAVALTLTSNAGCATTMRAADSSVERSKIQQVLDTLHLAAARADETTYFAQFAPDAVFLGTDPTERWTLDAFRAYAHPFFESGRGWAYTPSKRTISFAPNGRAAWFDEVVTSQKYGACRGTGVVVLREGVWRVAQYSLSLPIPNEMFVDVADAIKTRTLPSVTTEPAPYTFKAGDYLRWNTDHTERGIRPQYAIGPGDRDRHPVYRMTKDVVGRVSTVSFFLYGRPSDKSSFGAHRIVFTYSAGAIDQTYFDVAGTQVSNRRGVYRVRRVLGANGFATKQLHLDAQARPVEDEDGVAEVRYQRDAKGRRVSERRFDLTGRAVPEHNGFLEARFAFDERDYASHRRGYDLDGRAVNGPSGYHGAYFWFDENGTFTKEEFRDVSGRLAIFPRGGYARITFDKIDAFGQWVQVSLYGVDGELLSTSAAYGVSSFDDRHRRASIEFYDRDRRPAENAQGVARFEYRYDATDGSFVKRVGYNLKGEIVP